MTCSVETTNQIKSTGGKSGESQFCAATPAGFFNDEGRIMAKRFTDKNKWQDEWYLSLSNDYRIVWEYILDTCTIAGRLKKNFKLLNFCCNVDFDEQKMLDVFDGRLIDCGRFYFIPKYLKFQYAKGLCSQKPAIVSVRNELIEHGLTNKVIEFFGSSYLMVNESLANDTAIIKDKDKRKNIDKDKDKSGFDVFWKSYPNKTGKAYALKCWKKLNPDKELQAKILASVEQQKRGSKWKEDSGRYIPNPSTWLNQGRWDDECLIKGSITPPKPRKCLTCDATGTVYINDRVKLCTSCNALYESAPEEKSFKGHVIPKSMIDDIRIKEIIEGLRQ